VSPFPVSELQVSLTQHLARARFLPSLVLSPCPSPSHLSLSVPGMAGRDREANQRLPRITKWPRASLPTASAASSLTSLSVFFLFFMSSSSRSAMGATGYARAHSALWACFRPADGLGRGETCAALRQTLHLLASESSRTAGGSVTLLVSSQEHARAAVQPSMHRPSACTVILKINLTLTAPGPDGCAASPTSARR
jgi:hypothetical protein